VIGRPRRALGAFAEVCRTATPRAVEADYRALALALAMRQRQRALLVVLTDFVEADAVTLVAPASCGPTRIGQNCRRTSRSRSASQAGYFLNVAMT